MLEQRIVQAGKRSIRYLQSGKSGTALLFLHGLGRRPDEYGDLLSRLARHYRVIAPDLSGAATPRSLHEYKRVVREFCDALGARFHAAVGHSTGATISLSLSGRIRRLILMNPILPVRYGAAGFVERALEIQEAELAGVAGGFHGVLAAWRNARLAFSAVERLPAELALIRDISKYRFARLGAPASVLVLYGLPDEFFQLTEEVDARMRHALPGVQVKTLHVTKRFKANHEWPLLYPRRAAAEVLSYLCHARATLPRSEKGIISRPAAPSRLPSPRRNRYK